MSSRIVIAYWLTLGEPARKFFQGMIEEFARQHDAPVFEPHLTIHVGEDQADAAEKALSRASQECQRINLKLLGIDHSDEFIKTLFVRFAPDEELQRLNATIRAAAGDPVRYHLNPHLSLLYKNIPAPVRSELQHSIKLSFSEVTFDGLKAVRCVSPTNSRCDVEAWQVIATRELSR
jgi:2'-5' RNA ligase